MSFDVHYSESSPVTIEATNVIVENGSLVLSANSHVVAMFAPGRWFWVQEEKKP